MPDKPSTPEDDYFAREDVEKRYRIAKELESRQRAEEAEKLRLAHYMKCPKCGHDLETIRYRDVEIDRCFHCSGTWLDAGELEKLAGAEGEHKVLSAIVNVFRRPKD